MAPWEWPVFWDDFTRIGAAALFGGAIGLEREWKGHWAGLRTHMMVAIGCCNLRHRRPGCGRRAKRGGDARDPRHRVGHRLLGRRHDSEARSEAGDQRADDGQFDLAGGRAGHRSPVWPSTPWPWPRQSSRCLCSACSGPSKNSSNAGKPKTVASGSKADRAKSRPQAGQRVAIDGYERPLRQLDVLDLILHRQLDDRRRRFVDPAQALDAVGQVEQVGDADFVAGLARGFEAGVVDRLAVFVRPGRTCSGTTQPRCDSSASLSSSSAAACGLPRWRCSFARRRASPARRRGVRFCRPRWPDRRIGTSPGGRGPRPAVCRGAW